MTRFTSRGASRWENGQLVDARVVDVKECGDKKSWIDYMKQPLRIWSFQAGIGGRRCQNFFINGVRRCHP